VTPELTAMKFGVRKLDTVLYRAVWNVFNITNHAGMAECDRQTDGQTDRQNGLQQEHTLTALNTC